MLASLPLPISSMHVPKITWVVGSLAVLGVALFAALQFFPTGNLQGSVMMPAAVAGDCIDYGDDKSACLADPKCYWSTCETTADAYDKCDAWLVTSCLAVSGCFWFPILPPFGFCGPKNCYTLSPNECSSYPEVCQATSGHCFTK